MPYNWIGTLRRFGIIAMTDKKKLERILVRNIDEVWSATRMRQLATEIRPRTRTHTRRWYKLMALEDASTLRLARLLDKSKGAAGYGFLRKQFGQRFNDVAIAHHVDLARIDALVEKLKGPRDKTLVHIDPEVAGNASAFWRSADIRNAEVDWALAALEKIFRTICEAEFGVDRAMPDLYDDEG